MIAAQPIAAAQPQLVDILLPKRFAIGFVVLLAFLLFWLPDIFLNDGATLRHLNNGLYILKNGVIPQTNFDWFVNPKAPDLTVELWTDFLFAALYRLSGSAFNGIVLLSSVCVALAFTWSVQIAQSRAVSKVFLALALLPCILSSSLHWLARAHIFSYPCFLLAFYLGNFSDLKLWKRCALLTLVFALWVNFHGSPLIGFFVLLVRPFAQLAKIAWRPALRNNDYIRQSLKELLPFACALLACCLSIRGFGWYAYVLDYMTHPQVVGYGLEWGPLTWPYKPKAIAFVLSICLVVASYLARKRLPELHIGIMIACLALAGFRVMRFIPYFALLAMPLMCPYKEGPRIVKVRKAVPILALSISFLLSAVFLIDPRLRIENMSSYYMPVGCVDYLVAHPPVIGTHKIKTPIGFCFDNWGSYIAFKTGWGFFIDDKTQAYPFEFNIAYKGLLAAAPGWQEVFDKCKFDYALVPKVNLLNTALSQTKSWRLVATDSVSNLYYRI